LVAKNFYCGKVKGGENGELENCCSEGYANNMYGIDYRHNGLL
jgi:hypothetical protein